MSTIRARLAVAAATVGITATVMRAAVPGPGALTPEGQLQERQREAAHSIRRSHDVMRRDGERLAEAVREDGLRSREVREREEAAQVARGLLRARTRGR